MNEAKERLQAEIDLLQAMYPEAVSFTPRSREVRYVQASNSHEASADGTLVLRLPDQYPVQGAPEVISAMGPRKVDLRSSAQSSFHSLTIPPGEETLDAIIMAFQDLLLNLQAPSCMPAGASISDNQEQSTKNKTVIIWLHHLLNTNKRKLALNSTFEIPSEPIAGLTKPGYPGILVFSGRKDSVDAHVAELRSQRWQAFQVRYDSDDNAEREQNKVSGELWKFAHGEGIKEVKSMSEITQEIVGGPERELFLQSVGVK